MQADKSKTIATLRCGQRYVGTVPGTYSARRKESYVYGKYMNLNDFLVDLIGIEPMTSSMPFNIHTAYSATYGI